MALDVRVELARADGGWAGTIDIPQQGATGLPLEMTQVEGKTVVFSIAGVPGQPTFNGTLEGDRISGAFTQGGRAFEFELVRSTAQAQRRPQDPQPPFPYRVEEVTFNNQDVTLAGTLTIPEGVGPFPAVVLLTGSGPQNRDEEIFDHRPFWVIADHLSRNGIAVLRYDDRGVGGSTGNLMQSTTADFADDALAAVALLRERREIAVDRIGLLGHSEGAMVAPIAASRSEDIAFVVLLAAPGVRITDLLALQTEYVVRAAGRPEEAVEEYVETSRQLMAAATADESPAEKRAEIRRLVMRQNELAPEEQRARGDALEQLIEASVAQMTALWYQHFLRYDPTDALAGVKVPVLALNGELDLQVISTQNLPALQAALMAAGNKDVTTRSMPSLNHMFQHAETGSIEEYGAIDETISPEVLDIITEWIRERFARPTGK
jgi:pimeloyl-ACP methyl ester carboxylesterase